MTTTQKRPFKYEIGQSVINRWNWNCFIIDRIVNGRGINCYIVESNEDEADDEIGGVSPNERWTLKEYEIKHRD